MEGLNAQQLYIDPFDARKFQKEIEKKGFVRDYEVKLVKKDGTEMDCLFNVSVRRASDGSISAYQGTITIGLRSPEPHTYELTVSDDKIGLPEAIDLHTTTSLGLHLVDILVESQLKGTIELERTGGTRVRIRFMV